MANERNKIAQCKQTQEEISTSIANRSWNSQWEYQIKIRCAKINVDAKHSMKNNREKNEREKMKAGDEEMVERRERTEWKTNSQENWAKTWTWPKRNGTQPKNHQTESHQLTSNSLNVHVCVCVWVFICKRVIFEAEVITIACFNFRMHLSSWRWLWLLWYFRLSFCISKYILLLL